MVSCLNPYWTRSDENVQNVCLAPYTSLYLFNFTNYPTHSRRSLISALKVAETFYPHPYGYRRYILTCLIEIMVIYQRFLRYPSFVSLARKITLEMKNRLHPSSVHCDIIIKLTSSLEMGNIGPPFCPTKGKNFKKKNHLSHRRRRFKILNEYKLYRYYTQMLYYVMYLNN